MSTATVPPAVNLPPGPRWPSVIQTAMALVARRDVMLRLAKKYGSAYTVKIFPLGGAVVISDPVLIKQLFQTPTDVVQGVEPNLDMVFGSGSTFGLQGDQHRQRRKLLVPPFHGKRMRTYEAMIEEETLKEISTWPLGQEFAVMPSTMRITLNAILRAVFGAEGQEFDALRQLMPPMVTFASRLAIWTFLHHDVGPWSPWGRYMRMRREFDAIVGSLIDRAEADLKLGQRQDVLSLMLQARYEDGSAMTRSDVADELLTLLAAGHETTATSLAWAVERLRRHPEALAQLVDDIDAAGTDRLQATIYEVQRTRPTIDLAARHVIAPTMSLGPWVIPQGYIVMANSFNVHHRDVVFPDAATFDPNRFINGVPDLYSWVPFGGGTRRCLGAAFANMEMNVVLRTILRHYRLVPTTAPDEKWQDRGVAIAPRGGGLAIVHRRQPPPTTNKERTRAAAR